MKFYMYSTAHMHSLTDGMFVSHRWAPVFHSSCAPAPRQKTAFSFLCRISFLIVAAGMIAVGQLSRGALLWAPLAIEEENGRSNWR